MVMSALASGRPIREIRSRNRHADNSEMKVIFDAAIGRRLLPWLLGVDHTVTALTGRW